MTLVVIGAGGHGKVVVSTLQAQGLDVDAVYDDDETLWGTRVLGVQVRGPLEALRSGEFAAVLGIGDNVTRQRLAGELDLEWVTAIHPRSYVHASVTLGPGTVVFAGAVIQPDAVLGRHVIVNTSSSIDHDCRIAEFSSIGPGAHLAGAVEVGARSALGTGSAVIPSIRIAADVVVGAGTVVIRDIAAGVTVVGGSPRVLSQRAS